MTLAAGLLVLAGHGFRGLPAAVTLTNDGTTSTTPTLDRDRWQAIVIHHSGSPAGSPESLDRLHRAAGLEGLGYHFVIGNGIDFGDGTVYASPRWQRQEPGAHVSSRAANSAWLNEHSIGICLIGNGERRPFTEAQLRQLSELVRDLQAQLDIPNSRVFLHSDLAGVDSPGRYFQVAAFEASLQR